MKKNFNNYVVLVNKSNIYNKKDFDGMVFVKIKNIEGKEIKVEKRTYSYYLKFKRTLKKLGIIVSITSGYRSLEEQQETIKELKNVYQDDNELYEKVAPVGVSEHHTGLALDITISSKKEYEKRLTDYYSKEELDIREQKYELMAKICSKYGFILGYPKNKEDITGYAYEPWHFRYVGRKAAKIIMNNHLTLEEYLKIDN